MPLRLKQPDSPLKIANFSTLSQTRGLRGSTESLATGCWTLHVERCALGVGRWALCSGFWALAATEPVQARRRVGRWAFDVERWRFPFALNFSTPQLRPPVPAGHTPLL